MSPPRARLAQCGDDRRTGRLARHRGFLAVHGAERAHAAPLRRGGLLDPAEVDPATGYRRYAPAQLAIAGRIRSLRDAGCSIPQIAALLPLFGSPDELRGRLLEHIRSLDEEAAQLAARRALAASLAAGVDGQSAPAPVVERLFPALRVQTLRRVVRDYPAEFELWAEMETLLGGADADPWRPGATLGTTYFDDEFREADVEMAIWREYDDEFASATGIEVVDLPECTVATAVHHGAYDTIAATTETIGAWIAAGGRRRTGAMFSVYLVGPGRDPNPANWVTEVNFPIG